jgi:hypothetical protein
MIRHHKIMPRSPAQSDFVVKSEPVPAEELAAAEAGAFATRWVMRATFFVLFVLVVLCLVGPHIPSGE